MTGPVDVDVTIVVSCVSPVLELESERKPASVMSTTPPWTACDLLSSDDADVVVVSESLFSVVEKVLVSTPEASSAVVTAAVSLFTKYPDLMHVAHGVDTMAIVCSETVDRAADESYVVKRLGEERVTEVTRVTPSPSEEMMMTVLLNDLEFSGASMVPEVVKASDVDVEHGTVVVKVVTIPLVVVVITMVLKLDEVWVVDGRVMVVSSVVVGPADVLHGTTAEAVTTEPEDVGMAMVVVVYGSEVEDGSLEDKL